MRRDVFFYEGSYHIETQSEELVTNIYLNEVMQVRKDLSKEPTEDLKGLAKKVELMGRCINAIIESREEIENVLAE